MTHASVQISSSGSLHQRCISVLEDGLRDEAPSRHRTISRNCHGSASKAAQMEDPDSRRDQTGDVDNWHVREGTLPL